MHELIPLPFTGTYRYTYVRRWPEKKRDIFQLKDVRTRSEDGIAFVLYLLFSTHFESSGPFISTWKVANCQPRTLIMQNSNIFHHLVILRPLRGAWLRSGRGPDVPRHDDLLIYAFILLTFCSQNLLSCKWITDFFGDLDCVREFKVRARKKWNKIGNEWEMHGNFVMQMR